MNKDQAFRLGSLVFLMKQVTLGDGDGLTANVHPVCAQANPNFPTARGGLVGKEFGFIHAFSIIRRERAVRHASYRIFGDACDRRKEA